MLIFRRGTTWYQSTRAALDDPFGNPLQILDCSSEWGDILSKGVMGWAFSGDLNACVMGIGKWETQLDLYQSRRNRPAKGAISRSAACRRPLQCRRS